MILLLARLGDARLVTGGIKAANQVLGKSIISSVRQVDYTTRLLIIGTILVRRAFATALELGGRNATFSCIISAAEAINQHTNRRLCDAIGVDP